MDATYLKTPLIIRLRRAYKRAHRRDRNTVLGFLIAQTLLAFFAAYLLDRLTGFPAPVRVVVTLGILGGVFGWQLRKNIGVLRSKTEPEDMARDIERRAQGVRPGGLHSMVVSATEFGFLGRTPGSAELRQRVLDQAEESEYDPTKLVLHRQQDQTRTRKWLLATGIVYIIWVLLGPSSMGIFFGRAFGLPLAYPTRTHIKTVDAPTAVARFEDVHFGVTASGLLPTQGMVEIRYQGSRAFDIPLTPVEDESGSYTAILERPQRDFDYEIRLGDAKRNAQRVRVVSPPVMEEGTLTIHPPDYTGRSSRTRPLGSFDLWEGGHFDLSVSTSKEVEVCELILGDQTLPLQRTENGFRIESVMPESSTPISVRLVGESGVENRRRSEFSLTVQKDQPPAVTLLAPDEGGFIAPQSLLSWEFRAEDDLGMTEVILQAETIQPDVLGDEGEVLEEAKTLEVRDIVLTDLEGAREMELEGSLVAGELGATPGTQLKIRIGARDRYPDRRADEGWSTPVTLRVVTGPELKKILAEELAGAYLLIQDIRDDMKRQRTAVQIRKDMKSEIGEPK